MCWEDRFLFQPMRQTEPIVERKVRQSGATKQYDLFPREEFRSCFKLRQIEWVSIFRLRAASIRALVCCYRRLRPWLELGHFNRHPLSDGNKGSIDSNKGLDPGGAHPTRCVVQFVMKIHGVNVRENPGNFNRLSQGRVDLQHGVVTVANPNVSVKMIQNLFRLVSVGLIGLWFEGHNM